MVFSAACNTILITVASAPIHAFLQFFFYQDSTYSFQTTGLFPM